MDTVSTTESLSSAPRPPAPGWQPRSAGKLLPPGSYLQTPPPAAEVTHSAWQQPPRRDPPGNFQKILFAIAPSPRRTNASMRWWWSSFTCHAKVRTEAEITQQRNLKRRKFLKNNEK
jgi:hypothetical protein